MKTKIFISGLILFIAFLSFFYEDDNENRININNVNKFNSTDPFIQPANFLKGFFNLGEYDLVTQIENGNRSKLFPLSLNLQQKLNHYIKINNICYPHGVTERDSLFTAFANYSSEIRSYYSRIAELDSGYTQYPSRPKIEYLCSGQSSIYKCIDITANSVYDWFYSYDANKRETGVEITDSRAGDKVIYCEYIPSNSGEVKYAV